MHLALWIFSMAVVVVYLWPSSGLQWSTSGLLVVYMWSPSGGDDDDDDDDGDDVDDDDDDDGNEDKIEVLTCQLVLRPYWRLRRFNACLAAVLNWF